jgi:hypothetical protein
MPTPTPTDTNYEFESHCQAGAELFAVKDKKYMSAYKGTGLLGVACEIIGISKRLLPLVIWTPHQGRLNEDIIRDVLIDLHNYSVMALMCIEEANWDGRITNKEQTNEQTIVEVPLR